MDMYKVPIMSVACNLVSTPFHGMYLTYMYISLSLSLSLLQVISR